MLMSVRLTKVGALSYVLIPMEVLLVPVKVVLYFTVMDFSVKVYNDQFIQYL